MSQQTSEDYKFILNQLGFNKLCLNKCILDTADFSFVIKGERCKVMCVVSSLVQKTRPVNSIYELISTSQAIYT